jgi:release factor glutamine methyltransferase
LQQSITIEAALKKGSELLSKGSRLDIELLLAEVLNVTRSFLWLHPAQEISLQSFGHYIKLCERRLQGEPVAYLLGRKEFWSLELEVNTDTLIPRPETETLVEVTLNLLSSTVTLTIAELGVGSGAIAAAIATERPEWRIFATDVSEAALQVASRNIKHFDLNNVKLLQSNWFDNLPKLKFNAVISNPPYIPEGDPHLDDLSYEPRQALVSGEDGLQAIKLIISQAGLYLDQGGLLALEHGYNQAASVQKLLNNNGFGKIESHADLNGILRVTTGFWKGKHG